MEYIFKNSCAYSTFAESSLFVSICNSDWNNAILTSLSYNCDIRELAERCNCGIEYADRAKYKLVTKATQNIYKTVIRNILYIAALNYYTGERCAVQGRRLAVEYQVMIRRAVFIVMETNNNGLETLQTERSKLAVTASQMEESQTELEWCPCRTFVAVRLNVICDHKTSRTKTRQQSCTVLVAHACSMLDTTDGVRRLLEIQCIPTDTGMHAEKFGTRSRWLHYKWRRT